jgi:argininosuccinate lyase
MVNQKSPNQKKANQMWGGQFESAPADIMARINASIEFDSKLYAQDIKGSIAHATMLAETEILTKKEANEIIKGLKAIQIEIESGNFVFKQELEDIHMNIEARLAEMIGDTAGKLHTARSRNDQVALDFKMFVRDASKNIYLLLKDLQNALLNRADEHYNTIIPGFTHLQTAQPVTLGHHLMAFVEMIGRDRSRIKDLLIRIDECPLGAAALAGTSFPIDRQLTAKLLDFSKPTTNSLDSVSDRDFAMEFLSCASICAVHLSRLAEEFIIWSSSPFNFIKFSDLFTSGSSIMPQKRNPDAAELVRGKSGRIFGSLISLLTTMKGLPLAYNKDMQEDKEPFFDASLQWQLVISATTGMIADFTANTQQMAKLANSGYSTATDLADWLVRTLKIPFRNAHHITAKIVKIASEKDCLLADLSISEMQIIEPKINKDVYNYLSTENSVKSRTSFGGTAPENVKQAIKLAKKKYL